MKPVALLFVVSLLSIAIPTVSAAPACAAESVTATVGERYVVESFGSPSYVEVWKEFNGVPGLQRASCEDGQGRTFAADHLEASTPDIYPPCTTVFGIRLCVF